MGDAMHTFRGQRLSTRETHLARAAYLMALDDAASGQLIASPEKRFPLPKATRPRVVVTTHCGEWRYVGGRFEHRHGPGYVWSEAPATHLIPIGQAVEVLALRANPTEEVEE